MTRAKRAWQIAWPPLATFLAVAGIIELTVTSGLVPRFILPAPSDVFLSLWVDRIEFAEAAFATGFAASIGLMASFALGLSVAMALSFSRLARRAFYPYAVFFQTVPIIAIAPLLVIWFGYGQPTTIASAFIVSIFPTVASALAGLQSTERPLLDLFKLYGASNGATLFKLRLPYAVPQILSGLRIAAGMAIIGAIVGEFVGGGGLGAVVDSARTQQRADKVFAAVAVASLLGLALVSAVDALQICVFARWGTFEPESEAKTKGI